jgi:PAS domain-containing protein
MSAPTIAYDPVLERPSSMMAASLQRSLREQQALLDNAGVGIVFIRQRVIVRCNQCYADIFGYPGEHALVGINSEHLHPSRDELRSLGREAYRTLSAGLSFRTSIPLPILKLMDVFCIF